MTDRGSRLILALPVAVNHDDFAGFHFTQILRPDVNQRARLGSENVFAAVDSAQTQRADAVGVANSDEFVRRQHDQRIRALQPFHRLPNRFFDAAGMQFRQQLRDHFAVIGGLENAALRL